MATLNTFETIEYIMRFDDDEALCLATLLRAVFFYLKPENQAKQEQHTVRDLFDVMNIDFEDWDVPIWAILQEFEDKNVRL